MLLFVSLSRCQSRSPRLSSIGCFLLDTQPPLKDTTCFDAFEKKKREKESVPHARTQTHKVLLPPSKKKKSSLSLAKNLASEKSVTISRRLEESKNDVSPSAHHSGTSAACQKACVCVQDVPHALLICEQQRVQSPCACERARTFIPSARPKIWRGSSRRDTFFKNQVRVYPSCEGFFFLLRTDASFLNWHTRARTHAHFELFTDE